MSKHEARITKQNDSFYALVVRIDRDGEENVLRGYEGRFFKTEKAALKSTENYITQVSQPERRIGPVQRIRFPRL